MTVTERFLKYVSFSTTSDEDSPSCPSTKNQLDLGKYLAQELTDIGLTNVLQDENGYVYGFIPATEGKEDAPTIGFIAHMDTAPAVSGDNIKPQIVHYTGGDIHLCDGVKIEKEGLERYLDWDIIVTDGKTLLGADDKAGIAEIFTACEYIINHPEIPHGRIAVCITPDEEIGRGADRFDLARFSADWAYTIDGGELGEIEYENFNAASAKITVNGVNIHPGTAKNKMKNATVIASKLITMLPEAESPSHTEGYEGFYHINSFGGNETEVKINMIIRDHDKQKFEQRKEFVKNLAGYLNSVYGENTIVLDLSDTYYNMKEKILPHFHIIENAIGAMEKVGVTPKVMPIRGGTDGARLSFMGLPCPNLSTGGANFHGVHEFVPVQSLEKMTNVIIELMKN